ncbi:tetratricopeptide (TPR) repeat protein [Algoriphagus sp. 4150]|uniref:type IX secretion system periplasmic lipoprotein PorW/SprE n=1 Tax=Algoriphagus sp. 4150 TaxID=2817756 RepID=UPI00285F1AB0|nr:gliding motility protein [Algoriphagus sp. 4150]MDR7128937.1 tetratricopeptide (TPR) repeat protein [Algoriphagus sp. 4150]
MRKFSGLAIAILLFTGACSSERNTFVNRTFHNVTAHYNAYYLADVKLKEVESEVFQNYKEDYTQILPVFIPFDSATIQANSEKLQSSRELASKAIEWHRISNWVDDSYYILGKLDYYQSHFDDAQNTFKYVNVNSKNADLRHQTLITLLRLYVDQGEFENANFTIDYLSKEKGISEKNRYDLYRTLAYYYEKRGDKSGVIGALDKAIEYSQSKKEKSRINFILAQRYQREGFDALAYEYYEKSLAGNPPYERSFYAQLYAQQVAELNASKDVRKVRKYYNDLYEDPKNRDLKDVVIYERALFEEKQGDTVLTLDLLHQAAKEPGSNPRVKGYIYQKLAEINLTEFKNYRATKYYLDSALTFINESDPIAVAITNQKESLDQYVFHYERINGNDSLLTLAELTSDEQKLVAENYIKSEEERLLREAKALQKPQSTSIFDNLLAFSDRGSGSSFYFHNSVAMQQGAIDFRRTWGNRTLQDNWRRSAASFQSPPPPLREPSEEDYTAVEEESLVSQLPTIEDLLAKIPNSPEQIETLNLELEESYFELGKLLYFDLKEIEQSIENLETLVRDYPNSSRKPEAYYLLYLAQKDLGGNSQQYVGRLNREFPESQYTYSVNNPDAASGNLAYVESSKRYEQAYDAFYDGQYQISKAIIKSALEEYPLTRNTERLLLLDIMVTGKMDTRIRYRERLENYIQNAQDTNLVELARNMLKPMLSQSELAELNPKEIEEADSTKVENGKVAENGKNEVSTGYKYSETTTHIFVIAMDPGQAEGAKSLLADLESFHSTNFSKERLRTGNMNMNRENAIFIISPFSNAAKAKNYYSKFQKEFKSDGLPDEVKSNSFVISIENFQALNKSKNLEEYRTFFKSAYK